MERREEYLDPSKPSRLEGCFPLIVYRPLHRPWLAFRGLCGLHTKVKWLHCFDRSVLSHVALDHRDYAL